MEKNKRVLTNDELEKLINLEKARPAFQTILYHFFLSIQSDTTNPDKFLVISEDAFNECSEGNIKLEKFMDNILDVKLETQTNEGYVRYPAISSMNYNLKDGTISLEFHDKFLSYINEKMSNTEFIKFKLEDYINYTDAVERNSQDSNKTVMSSNYPVLLYTCLMSWYKTGINSKQLTISELRELLQAHARSYDSFGKLKQAVLDPTVNEISALTELDVSYEPIKDGRKVTHIRFDFKHKE